MATELQDLYAFLAVVQAGGFRQAARSGDDSASRLSEAVRRLEARLGLRLLHRTTRHISPTEAGARLAERLAPALAEVEASLDVVNHFRERPAGTLRINVPANVARTVLPGIVTPFLKRYPEIRLEVIVEDSFVDLMASGCDAGIRYDERLEQDMIALPIGPRTQRLITAAARPPTCKHAAHPNTRATCCNTPACAASSPAAPFHYGSSNATAKSCASTRKARCRCVRAPPSTWRCRQRSMASASSTCSKTGCSRTWTAARWCRCWNHGASDSADRCSITPAGAICRRR